MHRAMAAELESAQRKEGIGDKDHNQQSVSTSKKSANHPRKTPSIRGSIHRPKNLPFCSLVFRLVMLPRWRYTTPTRFTTDMTKKYAKHSCN